MDFSMLVNYQFKYFLQIKFFDSIIQIKYKLIK